MGPLPLLLLALQLLATATATMYEEVPPTWLRQLEAPKITDELRQLADADDGGTTSLLFAAQFGPNTDLSEGADDWARRCR